MEIICDKNGDKIYSVSKKHSLISVNVWFSVLPKAMGYLAKKQKVAHC